MPLPSFTITGDFNEILGSVVDDELVETALSRARIQFRSNVSPRTFITWSNSLYRVGYVDAIITPDGDLVLDDGNETPVRLLAQDNALNIRFLQWQIRVQLMPAVIPPSSAARMRAFWFNAIGDNQTIDIATIQSVPRRNVVYVVPDSPQPTTNPYPELDLFPGENLYPAESGFYPDLGLYPALELFPA